MDTLIIFGAQYLIILSPLLALIAFFKTPQEKRKEMVIFALITLPLALIARHVWYDPRPFMVSGVEPLIQHAADNGFPSDHMLLAASLAAVVTYFNKKIGIALWVVALLIGASRMAAGVHHAADMLGSIFIALIATLIVDSVRKRMKRV